MKLSTAEILEKRKDRKKQYESLSEPQRTNYNQLIQTYNRGYTTLADGIPISELYQSFIDDFTATDPKTKIQELASEKVPLVTEDSFIETVNNYK